VFPNPSCNAHMVVLLRALRSHGLWPEEEERGDDGRARRHQESLSPLRLAGRTGRGRAGPRHVGSLSRRRNRGAPPPAQRRGLAGSRPGEGREQQQRGGDLRARASPEHYSSATRNLEADVVDWRWTCRGAEAAALLRPSPPASRACSTSPESRGGAVPPSGPESSSVGELHLRARGHRARNEAAHAEGGRELRRGGTTEGAKSPTR
jgi:hypothetical protein